MTIVASITRRVREAAIVETTAAPRRRSTAAQGLLPDARRRRAARRAGKLAGRLDALLANAVRAVAIDRDVLVQPSASAARRRRRRVRPALGSPTCSKPPTYCHQPSPRRTPLSSIAAPSRPRRPPLELPERAEDLKPDREVVRCQNPGGIGILVGGCPPTRGVASPKRSLSRRSRTIAPSSSPAGWVPPLSITKKAVRSEGRRHSARSDRR